MKGIRRAGARPSEATDERSASCQWQVAAAQDTNPPRRTSLHSFGASDSIAIKKKREIVPGEKILELNLA
ncbi:MAG: hypothetical protein PHI73_02730 [Patescibacteria group bacterium]|nr:hypothetical protein [Patescibacteria group bacterium]